MTNIEFLEENPLGKQLPNKPTSSIKTPSFFVKFLIRIGVAKTEKTSMLILIFLCIIIIAFAIFFIYQNRSSYRSGEMLKYESIDQTIFKN